MKTKIIYDAPPAIELVDYEADSVLCLSSVENEDYDFTEGSPWDE